MGFFDSLDKWINGNNAINEKNGYTIKNAVFQGMVYGSGAAVLATGINHQLNKMYPGYRSIRSTVKLYLWALAVLAVIHYNMEDTVVNSFVDQKTDNSITRTITHRENEKNSIDEFRRQQKELAEIKAKRQSREASRNADKAQADITIPAPVTASK